MKIAIVQILNNIDILTANNILVLISISFPGDSSYLQ